MIERRVFWACRLPIVWSAAAILLSACGSADVGAACAVDTDCAVGLLCDTHEGRGTCQEMHSHEELSASHHDLLPIAPGQPVPSVNLTAEPDPVAGWNLHLEAEYFTFAATTEESSMDSTGWLGHAHLLVDGQQLGRIYGPWHHLESLPSGEHELRVQLSTQDHRLLWFAGQTIEASTVVDASTGGDNAVEDHAEASMNPRITLETAADSTAHWNLHVKLDGFDVVAEPSAEQSAAEGSFRYYVDGAYRGRALWPWLHLGSLPAGAHEIRVELLDDAQRVLTRNGRVLGESLRFETAREP